MSTVVPPDSEESRRLEALKIEETQMCGEGSIGLLEVQVVIDQREIW